MDNTKIGIAGQLMMQERIMAKPISCLSYTKSSLTQTNKNHDNLPNDTGISIVQIYYFIVDGELFVQYLSIGNTKP